MTSTGVEVATEETEEVSKVGKKVVFAFLVHIGYTNKL